jgi:D-arabinose 1-dehydrogenase-like Zn-dependent alcohol dehydrogenase
MDRVALSATYTIDTVNTPRVINNSNRTANTSGSTAMASLTGPTLDANVKQKTVGGSTVQTVQTTTVEQTREYWL